MSIKGRNQDIGVAQLPVLTLLPKYRRQLLDSAFIHAAEVAVE